MRARLVSLMILGLSLCTTNINSIQELFPEGSTDNNPCVYNVERAFDYLPTRTDSFFSVWTDSMIKSPKYQQIQSNQYKGIWGALNHFQAIKRLPEHLNLGTYFAITGSDPITPQSQLFIVNVASGSKHGKFEKQAKSKTPPDTDHFVSSIILDTEYWHAGGIDSAGKYLAITVDNETDSKILFFDIENPVKPKRLKVQIDRPNRNAIAVGLTKLTCGHFVVAVWTDGNNRANRGLDFYFSRTSNLKDGFEDHHTLHVPETAFDNFVQKQTYENINFINDYTGKTYLVGTGNSSSTAPLRIGIDHADLFLVDFTEVTPAMMEQATHYEPSSVVAKLSVGSLIPKVTFVKEKHMYCKQGICNFNAGANIYIPDQQHVYLYALPHWLTRSGQLLNFAQYASVQRTYPD